MRRAVLFAFLAIGTAAHGGAPKWTWEAGKQSNNGAITIKSMNGATTYAGTQNPTGAVVKVNQSASTQPPTIVVQSTSAGLVFNWTTDCFLLKFDVFTGQPNSLAFGAGKYDGTANTFTGILGSANSSSNPTGAIMMSMMTGASLPGTANPYLINCGSTVSCAYVPSLPNGSQPQLTAVQSMPLANIPISKCYP